MEPVLLIDFGSTYTKITAVDVEQACVLGTARGITTVETNIMDGLAEARAALFAKTGELHFSKVLACSSAAGGLKTVAIGLVPELTAEAAKRAALGAGAKILGVYCQELNDYEIAEIAERNPDIILLAGGTDGGNKEVILHNARQLLKLGKDIPLVMAGNKSVAPQVLDMLREKFSDVQLAENVMPKLDVLNTDSARGVIRDIFLKRIVEAKGLNRANDLVDRMVMPTPAAVLRAAELLGKGTRAEAGIGDCLVVDIGGATTDVYSVAEGRPSQGNVTVKGLPEPYLKRTVEGDLGMRYSASALLKAAGAEKIATQAQSGEEAVEAYIQKVEANIDYLPVNEEEKRVEVAMGRACTQLAVNRHVGVLENVYTCFGQTFVQTGKDLTQVALLIGTGGVLVGNPNPREILSGALFDPADPLLLKPMHPNCLLDQTYIMSAMGLLGEEYPDVAVRMLKQYLVPV